jgi:hypothetical protein
MVSSQEQIRIFRCRCAIWLYDLAAGWLYDLAAGWLYALLPEVWHRDRQRYNYSYLK